MTPPPEAAPMREDVTQADHVVERQNRESQRLIGRITGSDIESRKLRLSKFLGGFNGAYSWTRCTPSGDLSAILAHTARPDAGDEVERVATLPIPDDIPEYEPDDISHLESLAEYLDSYAAEKGRNKLPASRDLFNTMAKRLRQFDTLLAAMREGVDRGMVANREAIALIDEINLRAESRQFWGIGQTIHAKLCTIRATLARAAALSRKGGQANG